LGSPKTGKPFRLPDQPRRHCKDDNLEQDITPLGGPEEEEIDNPDDQQQQVDHENERADIDQRRRQITRCAPVGDIEDKANERIDDADKTAPSSSP
jgi:hypothetical protein